MRWILLWKNSKDMLASSSVREGSIRGVISFLSNRGAAQIVLGFSLIAELIAAARSALFVLYRETWHTARQRRGGRSRK
jgi:hypothetical protein